MKYKRANIFWATFLFLFVPSRYQRIAAEHNTAINLESPDLRMKYEKGTYKPDIRDFMINAVDSAKQLRTALLKFLFAVLITLFIALIFAYCEGSINTTNLSWKGVIEISAAFLLMWSTLFELGWGLRTWKGQALHELIHSFIFRVIFVTGSFFLMLVLLIK